MPVGSKASEAAGATAQETAMSEAASDQSRHRRWARSPICRRSKCGRKNLDARTDLFSFGAVLYEMATGTLPFRGESSAIDLRRDLNRAPVARRAAESRPSAQAGRHHQQSAGERSRTTLSSTPAEMRADLKRLKRETESRTGATRVQGQWRSAGKQARSRPTLSSASSSCLRLLHLRHRAP